MKKKRRKKNKGRKARLRKLNLFENKNATHRENEQMIKRLNRGKKPNAQSESEKNQKLAKLAGLDLGGPSASGGSGKTSRFRDHKRNNDKKRLKVGGMESTTTSGKRSRILYPDQSPEVLQDDAIDLAIIVVEDPKVKVEVQNVGAMINSTPR